MKVDPLSTVVGLMLLGFLAYLPYKTQPFWLTGGIALLAFICIFFGARGEMRC